MSYHWKVDFSESTILQIVLIFVFLSWEFIFKPTFDNLKDLDVSKEYLEGWMTKEGAEKYLLFDLFDNFQRAKLLFETHQFVEICLWELPVETKEWVVALLAQLVRLKIIFPEPILIDMVEIFGHIRIDMRPYVYLFLCIVF